MQEWNEIREPAGDLNFGELVRGIRRVDRQMSIQAGRAVNTTLTLRNWMIGLHISEFELKGADRAAYGENLFAEQARRLTEHNVSNCNRRQLYRYMRLYRVYPGIVGTLSPQLKECPPRIRHPHRQEQREQQHHPLPPRAHGHLPFINDLSHDLQEVEEEYHEEGDGERHLQVGV